MTQSQDVLIIGGGVSGLLTAMELKREGFSVTVLEQSALGRESSWAGGGILLPIYPWRQPEAISALIYPSLRLYPELETTLIAETGIRPEYRACGMLITQNPDSERAMEWCQRYQVAYEVPTDNLLKDLGGGINNPLWLPEVAQVRNPRLLAALKAYVLKLGVRVLEQAQIERVHYTHDHIDKVKTKIGSFTPDRLVLTTGAWTSTFLSTFLPDVVPIPSIHPVKGQMLLFKATPSTLMHMVLSGDRYLIPRADGRILAGSTVESSGFDKATTQEAFDSLYQFAIELLPALKPCEVETHWAGLRPGSKDGIPTIGFHPKVQNLALNAGHFRNGLVMGPTAARLLVDLALGRQPIVDPVPYRWQ